MSAPLLARPNLLPGRCSGCYRYVEARLGAVLSDPLRLACKGCASKLGATAARCMTCRRTIAMRDGELAESPPQFFCSLCAIQSGVRPDGVSQRVVQQSAMQGFALRQHQVEDALRVSQYRAYANFGLMGSGKTGTALIGMLRTDMPNLVFVPGAVKFNWDDELEEWRPDLRVILARSNQHWSESFHSLKPGEVLLATYGMLPGGKCAGCVQRRNRHCAHTSPDSPHPIWVGPPHRGACYPYHRCKGEPEAFHPPLTPKCTGCWQRNPLPKVDRPMVLLGDEVHALKSPTSLRTKRWRQLRKRIWAAGGHVYGLTGTPWENRPKEGWEVLTSLGLERAAFDNYDTFYEIFRDWFESEADYDQRPAPTGRKLAELHVRLRRVSVARRTLDVLPDLPDRQYIKIEVPLNKKTIGEVNEAVQRMFAVKRAWEDVERGHLPHPWKKGLRPDEAERRRQKYEERVARYFLQKPWDFDAELVQAVTSVLEKSNRAPGIQRDPTDPTSRALAEVRRLLSLAKIAAVEKWVVDCEEQDEPVVLLSQHVEIVKRLGERRGWIDYYGGKTDKARHEAVRRFQSGEVKYGISGSIPSIREGVNLQRARVMGFVDLNYNEAVNRQARARIWRMGSEKHESVLYYFFVAQHPVDKGVFKICREKAALLDAVAGQEAEKAYVFTDDGESA